MNRLLTVFLFCLAGVAWVFVLSKAVTAVRQPEFRRWNVNVSPTDETSAIPIDAGEPAEKLKKGEKRSKKDYPIPADTDLFTNSTVVRIEIEIPRSGIAALRNTGWGNGQERPTVKATIKEGATVYTNVAVHLKGAAGSFRPIGDTPCFTLNFDKFAPGQHFHGLYKISLNNSAQDSSRLSEKVSRELFQAAGVPVPRAGHATVALNGRDLGLYVLLEGYNKQFLKRHFKNAKGNLYDGGFCQEITGQLSVNSGDDPDNDAGLKALIQATRIANPQQRLARLEEVLDMDRFLSYLAMDMMLCNWDGYAVNRNNWRLFHDLDSNKMVFLPHGLDQMFGTPQDRGRTDFPINRQMQGLVAQAVVGTAQGRRRYLERVGQLYTNVYQVDRILERVDEMAAVIQPVSGWGTSGAVKRLKQRIQQRDQSLKQQLAALAVPKQYSTNGVIRPTGWQSRIRTGGPILSEPSQAGGGKLLAIAARKGESVGSWRTTVVLDEGQYQFEGKIRTKEVKPGAGEAGNGAELRISRGAIPSGFSGNVEWRKFTYPFEVQESGSQVELVCELRAASGEAWFDPESLRVVRLR